VAGLETVGQQLCLIIGVNVTAAVHHGIIQNLLFETGLLPGLPQGLSCLCLYMPTSFVAACYKSWLPPCLLLLLHSFQWRVDDRAERAQEERRSSHASSSHCSNHRYSRSDMRRPGFSSQLNDWRHPSHIQQYRQHSFTGRYNHTIRQYSSRQRHGGWKYIVEGHSSAITSWGWGVKAARPTDQRVCTPHA
jgi:hypothetical protein